MSKLGYTFYPKDWQTDDDIFELTLEERGFYRELIDLAMLNDNKTKSNVNIWSRKFNASKDVILSILKRLLELDLIEYNDDTLFIPSCEKRLKLVRGGRNGGKKKPNAKPNVKPNVKQIEIEIENKVLLQNCLNNKNWLNLISKNNNLTIDKLKTQLIKFENDLKLKDDEKGNMKEFKSHFINWLNKQPSSEWKKPNYF